MANDENLISLATRSQRERTEIARKGQKASVESRRENKRIKNLLDKALDKTRINSDGREESKRESGVDNLATRFANGDLKAIKLAAQLLGEWEDVSRVTIEPMQMVVSAETEEKLKKIFSEDEPDAIVD